MWQPVPSSVNALVVMGACVFMILIPNLAVCLPIDKQILNGASDLNFLDMFVVTSNYRVDVKIDMDMMFTIDEYKSLNDNTPAGRAKRKAHWNSRWPGGYVPYTFTDSIRWASDTIKIAIDHWEMYTCLIFNETELTNIGIQFIQDHSTGCASYVGYRGWIQPVYLGPGCLVQRNIIHEIGHAVGFFHEMNRGDRDSYISINYANIPSGIRRSFENFGSRINDHGVIYDYRSVMHYTPSNIITTLDPVYQNIIGHTQVLSFKDIKLANLMYGCQNLKADCPTQSCPFNGFVFFKAFKGKPACECFCDSGDVADPLVPCSSIDKEVPGYNLSAAGIQASTGSVTCLDLLSNCEDLKAKGKCSSQPLKMRAYCAKTCNSCGKGEELCVDEESLCPLMKVYCNDSKMKEFMSNRCPKTCKVCSKPSTACQVEPALNVPMEN